jgi:hypothetical protein
MTQILHLTPSNSGSNSLSNAICHRLCLGLSFSDRDEARRRNRNHGKYALALFGSWGSDIGVHSRCGICWMCGFRCCSSRPIGGHQKCFCGSDVDCYNRSSLTQGGQQWSRWRCCRVNGHWNNTCGSDTDCHYRSSFT